MSHNQPETVKPRVSNSPKAQGERTRPWVAWLLSGEFKLWALGLFLVSFGLYELAKQELSILIWRKTEGTVLESQTEWLEQKKDGFRPQFAVHVRYHYTVGEREYESSQVTTGEPMLFYGAQEAAEFRKRFPPGSRVTVLYAPYAPSQATLIAERSSGPWILLGFGVPCLLGAIYVRWADRQSGEELHPDVDIPIH